MQTTWVVLKDKYKVDESPDGSLFRDSLTDINLNEQNFGRYRRNNSQ